MGKKKLLIVESPAKAGTIKKYLGNDFTVEASMGHIIDLPKSQLGVDVDHDFEPKYITIRGKGPLLAKLKKEAKAADVVYLATDPDREGEAISWHLAHAFGIDENEPCRVTFNEITKTAVKNAIKEPRTIDMDLVNAQQARRVLDRIVGYKISPILWQKVKKGLSAGRVQSVATRLVCDREDEIMNFVPREYWTVEAVLRAKRKEFTAKYYGVDGKETPLSNQAEAQRVIDEAQKNTFIVDKIRCKEIKKNPYPPFTTSTLQQDASRKYGFNAAKTMQIAQMLYEGINLGGKIGTIGLITYMRTDSLRIAHEAQAEAAEYLTQTYGKEYCQPKQFKTKKNAQDAHEAIRPTSVMILPIAIKDKLTTDQYKLYKLIWERFVASQMPPAVYDTMNVSIQAGRYTFHASGSILKFKGYKLIYEESTDEAKEKDKMLPPMTENQQLSLKSIDGRQHFTQPPPRFTEASLVKTLEDLGIGRPSTYAPTISTIVGRGYVVRNKRQLVPTELGMITTDIMKRYFSSIVDVDFTAGMEEKLDDVEDGKRQWEQILRDFYPPFAENLETAEKVIANVTIKDEESDVVCEKCGRKMVYKISKFGKFLACPGYPECKNTKAIRHGTGVECPRCDGEILMKKTRKGRTYYGCENYPKCDFMSWDEPVKGERCPKCGSILLRKKGNGAKIICVDPACGYTRSVKKEGNS